MANVYAWYYNAGQGTYYWTESYNMSATQFANEVSNIADINITASDISAVYRQSDVDAMLRRAKTAVYVP